jgi:hypothetical protein
VFTVIPVVCNTCKHVLFFNAVSAGLFENGQPRGLRPDTQAEPEK